VTGRVSAIPGQQRELAARARRVIPGGVSSGQRAVPGIEDLVVTRAHGGRFWDAGGKVFLDFHLAFGPLILGHRDPDVDAAVAEAGSRIDLVGVGRTQEEIELAELLVELVPSVEQVLFTASGSEGTFHAIRLARAVTGRRFIIKFQGCFHGWHDAVALNVISPPERLGQPDPLSAGMMPDTVAATMVLPFNDLESITRTMEAHGADVAAVIVEPIAHSVGAILPEQGFLQNLRTLCDRYGCVLIFDEVVTGFRHAIGGFQSIAKVRPDLTVLGKAMANGYPIAAVGGRADLMSEFSSTPGKPVFFAGTYNGHSLCAAAAIATIAKLRAEPVLEHVSRLGEKARQMLAQALAEVDTQTFTTGFGSVFLTYFLDPPVAQYGDLTRNDQELFTGYRRLVIEEGCFELPLNLKKSQICYAHTDADVEQLVECTQRAVATLVEKRR
jgi:glutamate-1-semialdehyde 2,1-aminomutase